MLFRSPDGNWSTHELAVPLIVNEFFYKTKFAFLVYALLAALVGFFLYKIQERRSKLKNELLLEKREAEQLQALDDFKTKLYTNITHEFRTPLTVILGMAAEGKSAVEQLSHSRKENKATGDQLQTHFDFIERNSQSLLRLVNQMLDLSKLEAGKLSLQLVQADIIQYLQYVSGSFQSFAAQKNILLHFLPEQPHFVMDFDKEKMLNILSNLLSNAIKFTPKGGHIYLMLQPVKAGEGMSAKFDNLPLLKLTVKDTGIGIPPENVPHIFERFYQISRDHQNGHFRHGEGTGIGLALVHELVKLMNGAIQVESEPGRGTQFTIWLPVTRNAMPDAISEKPSVVPEVVIRTEPVMNSYEVAAGEEPLLLVVEDNPDVAYYLRSTLASGYRILQAADGKAGLDLAVQEIPDLIISDVMMPGMDGFAMLQALRKDERTCHIPVVLLTAKVDIASRLEGLNYGADAYLAKPFHQEELRLHLRNLLEQQKRIQQRFSVLSPPEAPRASAAEKPGSGESVRNVVLEHHFREKIYGLVSQHLDDSGFGIEQLCREMAMSESQLNRKIKAVSGRTLSIYIRSIRLQEAKKLLQTTDMNVSEVAYAVGFSDPAYFSRTFSQEFGQAPSEFR